jgi:ATP-dependent protease ClpP protease subunit
MLIHEIRSGCWGKKSEIDEHFENMSQLSKLLIDYYKDHTKMNEDDLKEILKHDYYWDARTCVEKGLVDEIM